MKTDAKIDLRFWPLLGCASIVFSVGAFLAFVVQIGIDDGLWSENGHVETAQLSIALFAAIASLVLWRQSHHQALRYTCIVALGIFFVAVAISTREMQSCVPGLYDPDFLCFNRYVKRAIVISTFVLTLLLTLRYVKFSYGFIAGVNWLPLLILAFMGVCAFFLNEAFDSRNLVAYEELVELLIFSVLAAIPCQLIWTNRVVGRENAD